MWQNWAFRGSTAVVGALLLGGATLGIAGAAGGLHLGRLTGRATPHVSKVAPTNPDGHCVLLPSVSDIIRHPEKHPGWYVVCHWGPVLHGATYAHTHSHRYVHTRSYRYAHSHALGIAA